LDLSPINTILLALITVILGGLVKFVLARINTHHQEAMTRLDTINLSMVRIGDKLDRHIEDHAVGRFRQANPDRV